MVKADTHHRVTLTLAALGVVFGDIGTRLVPEADLLEAL